MNVVVTGGLGLQGSHLAQKLTSQGHQVTVIDNKSRGIAAPVVESIEVMDLREEKPNLKGVEAVFHLAARVTGVVHGEDSSILMDNLRIDFNVIESCARYKVNKLVYASSCAAEVEQESGYGWAKLTTEKLLAKKTDIPSVILRMFNIYGPGEAFLADSHVIPELLRKMLWEDEVMVYGDGSQTRPFLYVDDAVEAYLMALDALPSPCPIDIAGMQQVSVSHLLSVMSKITGRHPTFLFRKGSRTGPQRIIPDLIRAEAVLGWFQRTPIEEGIRKTAEWMKSVHTSPVQ